MKNSCKSNQICRLEKKKGCTVTVAGPSCYLTKCIGTKYGFLKIMYRLLKNCIDQFLGSEDTYIDISSFFDF